MKDLETLADTAASGAIGIGMAAMVVMETASWLPAGAWVELDSDRWREHVWGDS
ncbi:hypothetical protein [Halobacterium salinarum]|uniref:hypothetical protein n=1 Tax=Halobacterium salinarum TaxID=2242 RepID=UPI0030CA51D1